MVALLETFSPSQALQPLFLVSGVFSPYDTKGAEENDTFVVSKGGVDIYVDRKGE